MLTFTLCVKCGKHGRFVGTPNDIPVEVGSKCIAFALLELAMRSGALSEDKLRSLMLVIYHSRMSDVEDASDIDGQDGSETCVDLKLREHIATWNEAAAVTNCLGQFAQSDFHDYVEMLEAPIPQLRHAPQPNN
ncbi:MAG: hypothetical protein WC866_04325 [Patescibacteria group bacterium]|jgi:hypothetical protein